jgi:hypothetical protein
VTTAAVVQRLSDAFSPICPYLFDKLCQRTAARASKVAKEKRTTLGWIDDLVSEMSRHRRKAFRLLSEDATALDLLRDGRDELAALTRTEVTVEKGKAPDGAKTFGPVAAVLG